MTLPTTPHTPFVLAKRDTNDAAYQSAFNVIAEGDHVKVPILKYSTPEFKVAIDNAESSIALNTMDIVIVGAQQGEFAQRAFYRTGAQDTRQRPVCSSENGVAPNRSSTQPQAASCSACPQNVSGSAADGKSKACSFKRKFAVVPVTPEDPQHRIFFMPLVANNAFGQTGFESQNLYSMKGLAAYIKPFGYRMDELLIRMTRRPNSNNAMNSLCFSVVGFAPEWVKQLATPENKQLIARIISSEDRSVTRENATNAAAPTPQTPPPAVAPTTPAAAPTTPVAHHYATAQSAAPQATSPFEGFGASGAGGSWE